MYDHVLLRGRSCGVQHTGNDIKEPASDVDVLVVGEAELW